MPTCTTGNSQTLIDLLFSSNSEHFSSTSAVACTGSDHFMIYGEREEKVSAIPQTCTVGSFKRCDKDTMLTELHRAPWQVMEIFSTIDEKWEYWKSLFLSIVNIHAPFVKVQMKRDSLGWIDKDIHKLMRARNYFQKKHQKTQDHEHWEAFKNLRNEVWKRMYRAKEEHYTSVCQNLAKQPKKVWRHLNSVLGRKIRSKISSLKNEEGTLITNDADMENKLASHFSSIPSPPSGIPAQKLTPVESHFQFTTIPEEKMCDALSTLDVTKATGTGGISAGLFRMTATEISHSLTSLFNSSLKLGQFPSEW